MKKYIISILILLALGTVVYAAPQFRLERTLLPVTDSLYDLGTTTRAWRVGYFDQLCLTADTCETTWPSGGAGGSSLHVDGGGFVYPQTGDYHSAPKYVATSTSEASTFAGGILSTASSTFTGTLHADGVIHFQDLYNIDAQLSGGLNRLIFKSSAGNADAELIATPVGSNVGSEFIFSDSPNLNNFGGLAIGTDGTNNFITSTSTGSGTTLPLKLQIDGTDAISIDTSRNVSIDELTATNATATNATTTNIVISGISKWINSLANNNIVYSPDQVGAFAPGFYNPVTGGGIGIDDADNVFLLNNSDYDNFIYLSTTKLQLEINTNNGIFFGTADDKFGFGTYNASGGVQGILDFSSVASSNKTFTFPNVTGTLALTSDLYTTSDFAGDLAGTTTDALSQGSTNLYNQTHTGEVTGATTLTIASNIIDADNIKSTNSPSDNQIPSYDQTSGGFTWVDDQTGGGGGDFAWTTQSYGVSTSTTLGFLNGFLSTASSTIDSNLTVTGNVGIGTDSPVSPLSFANSTGEKISFFDGTNSRFGAEVQSGELRFTHGATGVATFGNYNETTFTQRLRIGSTGVKIGTTTANATQNLHIYDDSTNTTGLRVENLDSNIIYGASAGLARLFVGGVEKLRLGSSIATFNQGGLDTDFNVKGDTDGNLLYVDASTDRIGIGTNAPDTKLDVHGTTTIEADGTEAFLIKNTAGQNLLEYDTTNKALVFREAGGVAGTQESSISEGTIGLNIQTQDDRIRLLSSNGTVMIQTFQNSWIGFQANLRNNSTASIGEVGTGRFNGIYTSNTSDVKLNSNTQALLLEAHSTQTADLMQIRSNGATTGDLLVVNSGGDVGIGDATPSFKLEVVEGSANSQLGLYNGDNNSGDVAITFRNYADSAARTTIGIDDSDNDYWKISRSSVLGTDDILSIRDTSKLIFEKHIGSEGTAPTLSSCGSGGTVRGSDTNGIMVPGGPPISSCVLNFSTAYDSPPSCVVSGEDSAVTYAVSTTTTSTMTVTGSNTITSDDIHYICMAIE